PLCTIIAERTARYIDNMLFEHVSDRGFRAKYREAGGFCSMHAKNLESYRDGLAVAILGVDILTDKLVPIKKRKISKPKALCPACTETERIEREFLGFIAECFETSFTSIFTASDGLCLPHYSRMIQDVRKIPAWIETFQIQKFQNLLTRSKDFIEFSAWGRQSDFDRLSAADKIVWKELARTLRGNAD
ncbi:MAG TPA: hypothetical protein VJ861_03250, partial [Treponemataceae bacterium]|nr:hypothetical protein [Treponemataceae bacterium]